MTTILGIETSCDETAAAVVVDGLDIRSNVISTQVEPAHLLGDSLVDEACAIKAADEAKADAPESPMAPMIDQFRKRLEQGKEEVKKTPEAGDKKQAE